MWRFVTTYLYVQAVHLLVRSAATLGHFGAITLLGVIFAALVFLLALRH